MSNVKVRVERCGSGHFYVRAKEISNQKEAMAKE